MRGTHTYGARLSPDSTGTLLDIADTQHSEEDTYAMPEVVVAAAIRGGSGDEETAAATAMAAQLQAPEEYTSGPTVGPGPSGPSARARARVPSPSC